MWQDFCAPAHQEDLPLLFYDELLNHRLTKQVANLAGDIAGHILTRALQRRDSIPDAEYDFDRAKADAMRKTST